MSHTGGSPESARRYCGNRLPSTTKYYQLTHDYLVPSLRDWLTRKQKETRRGRAELRLAERAALWNAKPENQQLPSWWEDLSIRWLTDRKKWTEPQRRMMRRAAGYFGLRTLLAVAILASSSQPVRPSDEASRCANAERDSGRRTGGLPAARRCGASTGHRGPNEGLPGMGRPVVGGPLGGGGRWITGEAAFGDGPAGHGPRAG